MNNLSPNNEQTYLDRIKAVRSGPELVEPTEEAKTLEVKPDDVETIEAEEVTEALEVEAEPVESGETQELESDQEDSYIDFNGEEVSFTQIEGWRKGEMMQADYTRKTQSLANDRKTFEADKESMTAKTLQLDDSIAQLSVFIDQFDSTEVDGMTLKELRDIDPEQYLQVTERQDKLKNALKDAKKLKTESSHNDNQAFARVEVDKLVQNNPQWLKDGKETKAYTNDIEMVRTYLTGLGYTEAQMQGALSDGRGQTVLDAAKYHASKKSNAAIIKKVRKAPVVTKTGGASKSLSAKALETAQANHKKYGTTRTAFELRKANKKFEGK